MVILQRAKLMQGAVLLCTMDGVIIRLPEALARRVDAVAAEEMRSRSNAVARLVAQALESRDVEGNQTTDDGDSHVG